jgi:hypothetical protein
MERPAARHGRDRHDPQHALPLEAARVAGAIALRSDYLGVRVAILAPVASAQSNPGPDGHHIHPRLPTPVLVFPDDSSSGYPIACIVRPWVSSEDLPRRSRVYVTSSPIPWSWTRHPHRQLPSCPRGPRAFPGLPVSRVLRFRGCLCPKRLPRQPALKRRPRRYGPLTRRTQFKKSRPRMQFGPDCPGAVCKNSPRGIACLGSPELHCGHSPQGTVCKRSLHGRA